jgi:hypothetical protein
MDSFLAPGSALAQFNDLFGYQCATTTNTVVSQWLRSKPTHWSQLSNPLKSVQAFVVVMNLMYSQDIINSNKVIVRMNVNRIYTINSHQIGSVDLVRKGSPEAWTIRAEVARPG